MASPDFFLSCGMTFRPYNAAKRPVCAAAALVWLACFTPAPAQVAAPDPHVRITVSALSDTLAPGSASELRIDFKPSKGFHVNAVPPMAVEFDSGSAALHGGKIVIPSDTATGYLDPGLPVRQPFSLSKSPGRGRSTLAGTLTYYYCSDEEGWCRRERLRFAVPVSVR